MHLTKPCRGCENKQNHVSHIACTHQRDESEAYWRGVLRTTRGAEQVRGVNCAQTADSGDLVLVPVTMYSIDIRNDPLLDRMLAEAQAVQPKMTF